MAAIVIGAAILAFTLHKAGEALLPLFGRERNEVFDLAWPLSLWILWLVALYALVPVSPLVPEADQSLTLMLSVAAVSLIFAIRIARVWRCMRRNG